jgi:putative acetyltransferase
LNWHDRQDEIDNMAIRKFSDADFDAIEAIYNLSKLDELQFEPLSFRLLPLRQDARRFAALMACDIFVYEDSAIQGYGALFHASAGQSEIRTLYVHPSYRGQGVAKRLLAFMVGLAGGEVSLNVARSNAPAKALYYAHGFCDVAEFETDYNGVPVWANRMMRPRVC